MGRPTGPTDLLRGAAVGAALLLTLVLAALLPSPGFTTLRFGFFALVAIVAWVGAAGAVWRRPRLLVGSGVALVALGFWQFTIGLVMLPTAGVFFVVAAFLRGARDEEGVAHDGGAVSR